MANGDSEHTLADYVAIAIGPALVMTLVGSLVFFLVEVLLGPHYPGQLLWILFFYVFALVLIARISMSSEIADRAAIYGLIIAVLVWLALMVYVKYPASSRLASYDWLINGVLVIVTWWSAHKLTVDSTLIDDTKDASGTGLLQEAGLDNPAQPVQAAEVSGKKRKRDGPGIIGWAQRFVRYRKEVSQRPHAPGVWVVYFSLAALPLFGLGQSLIPSGDVGRRRYAFWLMTLYIAAGLGLLLTTSFLNLRRYLRQRSLKMPLAMTGAWLTGGLLIIAVLLTLGALIPRPSAEYPLVDLRAIAGGKDRDGSKLAQGKGWAKDKGKAAEGKDGAAKNAKGQGKAANDKGRDDPNGKKGGKDGGRDNPDQAGGRGAGMFAGGGDEGGEAGDGEPPPPTTPESPTPSLPEMSDAFVNALKWIIGALVVLVILFVLLRGLLRYLANFTDWAKRLLGAFNRFWSRLFSWWQRGLPEAVLDEPERAEPPPPFVTFRDPFQTGAADGMSAAELVRYSFDALQAWGSERGVERLPGETPLEYVERLTMDFPALERAALDLVNLYVALAYARKTPTRQRLESLRKFWLLLAELVERPMSAGVG